jgi:hypothetical protein
LGVLSSAEPNNLSLFIAILLGQSEVKLNPYRMGGYGG